jgi:hypothetical protein
MRAQLETAADVRWRNWRVRGAESDRRARNWMRGVMALVVLAIGGWLVAAVLNL